MKNLYGENNPYFKHGKSQTCLHRTWREIKRRCYNPHCKSYVNYGARGIAMCEQWKEDFMAFYKWAMENGYKDGLSIERKDVDKGYYPENCCWITKSQQRDNRRDTLRFYGKTLKEISDDSGLKYDTVNHHYHKGDLKEWLESKGYCIETIQND